MQERTKDTEKLLKECDAGIKMGIASLDDVMNSVSDYHLEQVKGKEPNPAAKTMSHMKTKAVTAYDKSDRAVARLVGKGCDMGVKSLDRYLQKYEGADDTSRQLAADIIDAERRLSESMNFYM